MNNDQREPPPSYSKFQYLNKAIIIIIFIIAEVIEKLVHHPFNDPAARYAVPIPEHAGNVRYTAVNEAMPNTYGVQIIPLSEFGSQPVQCACPQCHLTIVTRVERTPGLLVWILCCILILFGCWFGCCLIPFCIPSIQNTQHYCPNCKSFIGKYRLL
jgi:lipopolysaccharide-induced tumor necrosis factor-alpha factor